MLRALLLSLVVAVVCAAPAAAATVDDVALGETAYDEVAVWGKTVAWRAGATVVLRRPDGSQRTFPWRGRSEGLTIGTDEAGRLALVYPYCASAATERSCRLRRVDVRTGRARFVAGVRSGPVSLPVLRRGVLAWISDEDGVVSRRLAGGRNRVEHLGRGEILLTGLDHDGRRFAITGRTADDPETETSSTEVRVGSLGKRRTRRIGGLGSSQEYQAVLEPMLNATSVDVLKDDLSTFSSGAAYQRLIRYPLRSGRRVQRSFGVPFVVMARGGGGTAIVQAPGSAGCAVERPDEEAFGDEISTTPAPCRVVLAGAAPFSSGTRRTVPELRITRSETAVAGKVTRRLINPRTGGTLRSTGVAGAAIRVAVAGERQFASGGVDATTDAQGEFSAALPAGLVKAPMLGAFTVTAPRAFAPIAKPSPGAD